MNNLDMWEVFIQTKPGLSHKHAVDKEAFFDPADDKLYRHPTFYQIPNDVKNM